MTWESATPAIAGETIAEVDNANGQNALVVMNDDEAYLVKDNWSVPLKNLRPHLGLWADDDGGPDVALAREPECYICIGETVTIEGMTSGDYSATYVTADGETQTELRFVDGGDAEFHQPTAAFVYVLRMSR